MIDVIPREVRDVPARGLGVFCGEYIYMLGEPFILISCISEPNIDAAESFLVFNGRVYSERVIYSALLTQGGPEYTREVVQREVLTSLFGASLRRLKDVMSTKVLEQPEVKYLFPERIEFGKVEDAAFRIEMCVNRDRLTEMRIIRETTKSSVLKKYIDGILAISEFVTDERPV